MDQEFDYIDFFAHFNVLELSIATALGASTYNFIKSLNEHLLYPIIGAFFNFNNLSKYHFHLNGQTVEFGSFFQDLISFMLVVGLVVLLIRYLFSDFLMNIIDRRTRSSSENADASKKMVEQNKEIIDKLSYYVPYTKHFGKIR